MSAFVDARTLAAGTVLTPDIAIVGGGPAGISLALALAATKLDILLLESGSMNLDPAVQDMYAGSQSGDDYASLDAGRLRTLGGGTNHWGGWCRPLDASDFEKRDWVPHSGWPFPRTALDPYYPRAQALVEAGPWIYDQGDRLASAKAPMLPLGNGGLYTSWFQFSKMRGDVLPTRFGVRYEADIKAAANIKPLLNANVTAIRLAPDARRVDRLDVATLTGLRFTVKPRHVVLAAGGMENARLLLASNGVMKAGVGNQNDLVGRFSATIRSRAMSPPWWCSAASAAPITETISTWAMARSCAPCLRPPPPSRGAGISWARSPPWNIRWNWTRPARPP